MDFSIPTEPLRPLGKKKTRSFKKKQGKEGQGPVFALFA